MILFGTTQNPFSSEYIDDQYLYIKKLFSKKINIHLVEILNYLNSNNIPNWKIAEIETIDIIHGNNPEQIGRNKELIYLNYKYFLQRANVIEQKEIEVAWQLKTLLTINQEIEIKHKEINYALLDQLSSQIISDLEILDEEIKISDTFCDVFNINKSEIANMLQFKAEPAIKAFLTSKDYNYLTQVELEKIANYYEYLNKKGFKYDIEFPVSFLNEYNQYCIKNKTKPHGLKLNVGFPSMIEYPLFGAYDCNFGKTKKVQGQSTTDQNPARIYDYGVGIIVAGKYSFMDGYSGINVAFAVNEIKQLGENVFSNTAEKYIYVIKKGERNPYAFSGFINSHQYDIFLNTITGIKNGFSNQTDNTKKDEKTVEDDSVDIKPNKGELKPAEIHEDYISELNKLVGISNVKDQISSLVNYIKMQKIREKNDLKTTSITLHSVFTGSPGTGKTTVARLYGGVLKQLGVLKKGHLIEVDRSGLVAGYLGQTAIKVDEVINKAMDGILFIDEAYSLTSSEGDSYGAEAVDIILKRMEDNRDRLVVILAGYSNEMDNFINSNPGLKSRFSRYISFLDYSAEELLSIFNLICKDNEYFISDEALIYLKAAFIKVTDSGTKNFGNGRYVRNVFEKIIEKHSNRVVNIINPSEEQLTTFTLGDIQGVV